MQRVARVSSNDVNEHSRVKSIEDCLNRNIRRPDYMDFPQGVFGTCDGFCIFPNLTATLSYWVVHGYVGPKYRDQISHPITDRIGALFEGSLPNIEGLMKAYGVRVSDIAQSDKVKTKDTRASELFANQIGPDSTSIWAAVTSGEAAVSVYLLGCMLARVFPGYVATSI